VFESPLIEEKTIYFMLLDIIFEWLIMYLCLCMQTSVILEAKLIFQAKKESTGATSAKRRKAEGLTSIDTGGAEEPRPYRAPVQPSTATSSASDHQYGHEDRGGPSTTTGTVGATVPCDRTDPATKTPKTSKFDRKFNEHRYGRSDRAMRPYSPTVPRSRIGTQPDLD